MASVHRDGEAIVVSLETEERETLQALATQVVALLSDESASSEEPADPLEAVVGLSATEVEPPDDEVLARLLPAAYRGDDDTSQQRAAEFRRYTDGDLRATKIAALQTVMSGLAGDEDVSLHEEQGELWLHALNDIRLSLGTRLDVTEDLEEEVRRTAPGSPRWQGLLLYDWLSMLQDSILRAMTGDS